MEYIIDFLKNNVPWIFSGFGVALIGFIIHSVMNKHKKKSDEPVRLKTIDNSIFISEYPPDGILIKVGSSIKKSWTIQNDGKTIWKDRYLKCIYCVPNAFYPQKNTVKMPVINPGEQYTLTVMYYAKQQGDFKSEWKMFDSNNNLIYPEDQGLCLTVSVR